ncbi:polysaccharide biosynthesis/export family protein [Gemmatimonas phototrophica]|nr:SLBB domain-containing protein [Gemmatimonas phototrophica]
MLATFPLQAQEASPSGAQRASRAELAERISTLERQVAGSALKKDARAKAMAEVAAIKARLQSGDFKVGDRFVLTIRQDSVRSDTVAVRDSLKVSILNIPDVTLEGVLRSELDARINSHVARYLRNVDTRTLILTRVSILGAVQRPGFYYAVPDRPLSDLVTLAGGPAPNAKLTELEVNRGSASVVKSKDSKRYLKEGRTLEQADVQSGDDVHIPQKRKINWQLAVQMLFILSSLTFAFINFLRWYYDREV